MSQRYIKDSFWTDPYIEKLSPDHKLIFLYLLTNPLSNISGVYEIRMKRMAYETGYDIEVVENIIKKFVTDKKVIQFNDWIVLVNHIKHQSLGNSTAEGVNREILKAPIEIQALFEEKTLVNSKNDKYSVFVLKDNDTPPIGPLLSDVSNKVSNKVIDKVIYGEFQNVELQKEEYDRLLEKLGEKNTQVLIEELSGYLKSTGKNKYKDHYATLLNWARRRVNEHQSRLIAKSKTIV